MVNYKKDQMHNKRIYYMPLSIGFISLMLITAPAFAKKDQSTLQPTVVSKMIGNGNGNMCSDMISSPSKLMIPLGKSTLIKLPEPLASRTVGNANVLQAKMISPLTLYVVGLDIGSTNMILQSENGNCSIIDVTVNVDPDALQQTLIELMPEEKNIIVTAAGDSLILSGTVKDAFAANQAVNLAQAYVARMIFPVSIGDKVNPQQQQQQQQQQQRQSLGGQYIEKPSTRVINMLSVGAQQQVMLEVKVAEVSKTLLDQLGAQATLGGDSFKLLTPFFATPGALLGLAGGSIQGPTIGNAKGNGITLDAQKRDDLIKILAEPTIMAISGQEGSFLAGGTIFIPVAQNNNGGSAITLEEKEFGVGVRFTPTVLAGGRINLKVAPEVSELNKDGIGLRADGIGSSIIPAFTTRKASTTVQLMDGQSFAIGGLIKNNTKTNIKAFPILGEIPILGALFRSSEFQSDKTELLFVVTPHLVKPLSSKDQRLPTDRYVEPSRSDLFLKGTMEGPSTPESPPTVDPSNRTNAVKPNDPVQNDETGFDVE